MSETATALAPRPTPGLAMPRWRMVPGSLGEAMEMANLIAGSELCPKAYRGRPQDCIVAYEFGAALGLAWMQALRSVSVINGQAALWGDAIPALIYGSGECERFHETFTGTKGQDDYTAVCIMKRRGMPDEVVSTFSIADAKTAKLWGKRGRDGQDTPWITYWERMLKMRARGFAARDTFADKLSGLIIAEEAMDYGAIEGHVVSVEEVPKVVSLLDRLPEGLRDNVEKAFAALNMGEGARLAKLNEFLGGDAVDVETQALALLEWCRDEFSKRRTGKPRGRKADNGKRAGEAVADGGGGEAARQSVPTPGPSQDAAGSSESGREQPGVENRPSDAGVVAPQGPNSTPVTTPTAKSEIADLF